jgi:hypothetical protein
MPEKVSTHSGKISPAPGMQISIQSNCFQAFGLIIHSEIPLLDLNPYTGDEEPDVHIVMGAVPVQLANPSLTGVLFQVKDNQFLLRIEGVAAYLVEGGKRITIEAYAGCDEKEIQVLCSPPSLGLFCIRGGIFPSMPVL